jgi:deoxyribodipyrimidine photo-lyase
VWITAESMGGNDPAVAAHPDLPVVFVFDEPLLTRLRLSAPRLVFLAEHLSDLATRRDVEIWLGRPEIVLGDRPLAATFTPVPGWHRRSAPLSLAALHPWPWLSRHRAGTPAVAAGPRSGGESVSPRPGIDGGPIGATESSTGRNTGALV